MAPRLSGQTSIFGVVFFVSKSLWELRDERNLKICNFDLKASEPCLNIDISNVAYYRRRKTESHMEPRQDHAESKNRA